MLLFFSPLFVNRHITQFNNFDFNTLEKNCIERGQTTHNTQHTHGLLDRVGPVGQFGENP